MLTKKYIIIALCLFACAGCSPCKKKSFKAVSDTLVTGVAPLGNGKYAVYIDFEGYFTSIGKSTEFKWPARWPGVWPGNDAFILASKDDCGMFVVLQAKDTQLRLDIRDQKTNFTENASDTFGVYKCPGNPLALCFNPADL